METLEKSIDIDRSLRAVYNQWTRFEDFPHFMEGVKSVRQIDDQHLEWVAEIAGKTKTWTAEITEQEPDTRISWRGTSGAVNNGTILFLPVNPVCTRVTMKLDYEPEGLVENLGDMLGIVSVRIAGDLQRFKEFIETRQGTPAGWRGHIAQHQTTAVASTLSSSSRL